MSRDTDDPLVLERVLNRLCQAAAAETLPRFRRDGRVENKLQAGFDPVTEADRAAEAAIRAELSREFPDHDILGEEQGATDRGSRYRWIIDPIDGTRAFICGIPVWGTLIGLYKDGVPFAGAVDQPFTGERYIALPSSENTPAKSTLCLRTGETRVLKTAETASLDQAKLMTTSPHLFNNGRDEGYFCLEKRVQLFRYGCDCYAYALLAAGAVDLVVESGLNSYDIAALIPLIENAGGLITGWDGTSAAEGGRILAAANARLHEQAMAALSG